MEVRFFIRPRYTWGPIYGSECVKQTDLFADLTDVTLADEDDQILNECKWCHLVAQFSTDAGGTTLWPKLQLMQVAPPVG